MQIAFIGLGRMGAPIAARLLAAGHALVVHDVNREAMGALAGQGATPADSPAEACSGAQLVLTCLPGPPEVETAVMGPQGLLQGMAPGAIHADLSSNSVAVVRRVHAALAARECTMLDAPVSGGVGGARDGTLQCMVGGRHEAFEQIQPVLQAFCSKVSHMGEVGCGTVVKLSHNLAYIATRSVLAECFTLGVKAGVEPERLLEAFRGSAFGQGLMLSHFLPEMVFKGRFEPVRFSMRLAHKDVGLATALGREFDVPMPMGALTEQLMVEALARGWADKDYGTAFLLQEERAGVQVRSRG
ncbi:NAD(P)-dependent oxidoreductase [Variovorax sp. KK3]|uniref:NAD(P)-dependent oxidoreductase n=1 Tax=Variovorax sp. KK3 TaxID=1855728 RepID=UPI00097C955A|nr:NAD(P)-dependent oxidoreductase [Variovorax sp. KK3]